MKIEHRVANALRRELDALADEKGDGLGVRQITRGSDEANDRLNRLASAALTAIPTDTVQAALEFYADPGGDEGLLSDGGAIAYRALLAFIEGERP